MRFVLLATLIALACRKDCPEGQARDNDGDCVEVADADTDADSDSDTDADADTDTDTDTYTVCDDGIAPFTDIQSAVDASDPDDTITVCAGTWPSFEVTEHDLTIVGVDGYADTLVFGTADVVAVHVQDVDLDLSGFTMRGSSISNGSGLYVEDATLALHDARFAENSAGVIVYYDGDEMTWERVVVEDNVWSGDSGMALAIASGAGPLEISHCIFRNNENSVAFMQVHNASVHNNIFAHNHLKSGSLLATWSGTGTVVYNNVFYDTTSDSSGAALYLDGGVAVNNIIAASGEDVMAVSIVNSGSAHYNDLWGNDFGDELGGTNMAQDPAFTDEGADDFTLKYGYSACTDAGDPNTGYDDPDGSRNDIGAFGGPDGDWVAF